MLSPFSFNISCPCVEVRDLFTPILWYNSLYNVTATWDVVDLWREHDLMCLIYQLDIEQKIKCSSLILSLQSVRGTFGETHYGATQEARALW